MGHMPPNAVKFFLQKADTCQCHTRREQQKWLSERYVVRPHIKGIARVGALWETCEQLVVGLWRQVGPTPRPLPRSGRMAASNPCALHNTHRGT